MLSSVDTTCQSIVRMCDCIWGLWVALSSRLMALAARTDTLPPFSSLSARSTSFIMLRMLFWMSLFFVIESRVSTARASRSWFSFSFNSFFDEVICITPADECSLSYQLLLNVFVVTAQCSRLPALPHTWHPCQSDKTLWSHHPLRRRAQKNQRSRLPADHSLPA